MCTSAIFQLDGDDEAEESVPKTSEDSDHASEAGEVSASEQSGDEQSEHEDAEDEDDQDGKAESEGEAEGMEDGDGDGNSSLDSSFAHCKPLAASSEDFVVGSNLKKAGRVFYGNDLFYVLFRLDRLVLVLPFCLFSLSDPVSVCGRMSRIISRFLGVESSKWLFDF